MRVLAVTSLILPVLGLAACATQQENPNYQFSSTYQGVDDRAATQTVAYNVPAPAPVYSQPDSVGSFEVYTRVDSDCVAIGSCEPQGVATLTQPVVSQPWSSPTEEMFAGGDTTPGFRALEGSLSGQSSAAPESSYEAEVAPAVPAPSVPAPFVPQAVAPRVESEPNTLTISGPIVAAESLSGTQSRALMHRVETGDTVYSLARRYCTSVNAIQSMNGLNAAYEISLGSDLKLPANCQ